MNDRSKTKQVLIQELTSLRQRITELEQSESDRKHAEEKLRESEEKYRSLLNNASDAILLADMEGNMLEVNKKAEKALRESEFKYKSLIENIPDIIFTIDLEGKLTFVSKRATEISGYENAEIINRNIFDFIPEEAHQSTMEKMHKGMKGEKIKHVEMPVTVKSGEKLFFDFSFSRIYKDGAVVGAQGTAVDITERKHADSQREAALEALRLSEENFRRSLEDSPLGVRIVTVKGATIYANQAILDIYGYDSMEEFKSTPVENRYKPESFAEHQIRKEGRKRGDNAPSEYGIRIIGKDGGIRHLQVFRKEILWDGEKRFQVLYNDITTREQAVDALQKSEDRFKNLYQESPIPTFTWQKKGDDFILIDFNNAAIQLTNGKIVDYLGNGAGELYRDRPQVFNDMNLCFQERSVVRREVVSRHFAPGRFMSVHYGFIPPDLIIVHTDDQTERKKAEEELLESEERFRAIASNTPDHIFIQDNQLRYLHVINPQLGLTERDMIGKTDHDFLSKEDADKLTEIKRQVLKTGKTIKVEEPLLSSTGEQQFFAGSYVPKFDANGQVNGLIGYFRNITERKKAEEVLRESEIRYRELFENMGSGVAVYETRNNGDDFIFKEYNTAAEKLDKIPRGQVIGRSVVDVFSGVKDFGLFDVFQRVYRTGKAENHPITFYKDEKISGWRENYVYKLPSGEVVAVFEDITERKLAETALQESEEKNRFLIDNMFDVVYSIAPDLTILSISQSMERILGYRPDELVGRKLPELNILSPESLEAAFSDTVRVFGGERIASAIYKFISKNGEIRWGEVSGTPLIRDGEVVALVSVARDITDRKQTEAALQKSEEKYRNLFNNAEVGMFRTRLDGSEILEFNEKYLKTIGYTFDELKGTPSVDMWADKHERDRMVKLLKAEGQVTNFEFGFLTKQGEVRTCITSLRLYRDIGIIEGSIMDITARKLAEKQINASLREKEILLSEVHHRVKNNLQVISGLLDLQARSSGNPELTEMLQESQSRIRSMAMVHEKLYSVGDFSKIGLADYARSLAEELFQSHNINTGKIDLIVKTDGEVCVDINRAIPCGLIMNELISNTLKHAFLGDRHGELQIILGETKNAEIEIVFRDNGLGLPDDVDIHQPLSVGLYLVNGLVKNQLDGQIDVRRDNGTEFRIKFPF